MSRDFETNKLFAYDYNNGMLSVWFRDQNGHCIDLTQELLDNLNEIWNLKLKEEKEIEDMNAKILQERREDG